MAVDINASGGAPTVALAQQQGSEVVFEHADVTDEVQIKAVIDRTVGRWGRLDILFNNAGIVLVKSIEETTEAEWDHLMAVNLKAVFLGDRKSTRLNSSHRCISYAVFCLKKKKTS